jgi:hypothetical protein
VHTAEDVSFVTVFTCFDTIKKAFCILQFEFKWPLDAPSADFDRVDAIAQQLRQTLGPS